MIRKILDRFILDKTLWKFILVGIINTIFGTALSLVLLNVFGLGYEISTSRPIFASTTRNGTGLAVPYLFPIISFVLK